VPVKERENTSIQNLQGILFRLMTGFSLKIKLLSPLTLHKTSSIVNDLMTGVKAPARHDSFIDNSGGAIFPFQSLLKGRLLL